MKRARGAAWLAHWTVNPEVAGSNPVEPAIKTQSYKAVASVTVFTLPRTVPSSLNGETPVDVLGPVEFGEVLMAYALHEWRGRLRPRLPAAADQFSVGDERLFAARILLQNRLNVIAGILAAGIIDCVKVRVSSADIPIIRVMGADPLSNYSKNKLAEVDTDGSGSADHLRRLAANPTRVEGPILACARDTAGPITIFDGMHRMAAWVAHVTGGREYPMDINLVLTARPSPVFELPPPA